MQTTRKIAVAGATGRVGSHIVEVLAGQGHDVVAMSRATGVDIITGEGLAPALAGVETIIDAATGASPEQQAATEFFTTSARNLHAAGQAAGVRRIVAVSIIGIDRFTAGYNAAKQAHERALRAGPLPVSILRAAQFHEFVGLLVQWGTRGEVSHVPEMRTQLVAARTVAEAIAALATAPDPAPLSEIAGPREEQLASVAELLVEQRGESLRIEAGRDPADPDSDLIASGALLPGPEATLAGPTFAAWLDAHVPAGARR